MLAAKNMATKLPLFETPFESYRATKIIGEGGAGRVYEVVNSSGETLALKCLAPERVTLERLKRFKNEIDFCKRQNHPNIIHVIDTGATTIKNIKCPFYVMKRYSGTLRTQMKSFKPEEALHAFAQILDGVEAAHLSGVWHRDLKPENVLWNESDKVLAVADFGIAHFEEEEIYTAVETNIAARMANFQYSAPEQRIRGERVDFCADIFALGLMLNELFTGEVPQGTGIKRIRDVNAEYGYLDDIVESMIQQKPQNRPNSIEAIKKELIGRKKTFIALQKYDEAKKQTVRSSEPPEFEPILPIEFDYANGVLTLKLSRNIPPGWTQEFQNPRGGHSYISGYGPENFQIRGNSLSINVSNNADFIQKIINNAKQYITAANSGYVEQLREQAARTEQQQRAELEKRVAEAELRKDILSKVKLS
jgi:serine/threonine protein kinase